MLACRREQRVSEPVHACVGDDAIVHVTLDGEKSTVSPAQFPDALAEYPGTVTHWALFNPVTGDMGDCAPLVDPLDVTAAGDGPAVSLTVFYSNNLDEV